MLLTVPTLLLFCGQVVGRRSRQIWKKQLITWSFTDPHHLIKDESSLMRSLLNTSFSLWENALRGRLQITENVGSRSDMVIHFARREHGDKEPLDGPGGMVAHSGLPPRGYLHLDADELWSFDGGSGVDLRYVILHETGHLLGLRHIWRKESIMNPYYQRLSGGMSLFPADVQAIRKLYDLN